VRRTLKVLALAPYPEEAASTRFRIAQFIPLLGPHGIHCELKPFIGTDVFRRLYVRRNFSRNVLGLGWAAAARAADLLSVRECDVVFIQREAALVGPPLFERIASGMFKKPIVLDLDDPLWMDYTSPVYGRLGSRLRCLNKTGELIRRSSHVVCGNDLIARHVSDIGVPATVLPTIVDTNKFLPKSVPQNGAPPVIGWIGTHTTLPYLEAIAPALEKLAEKHRFRLRAVGGGRAINLPGVEVDESDWLLEREVDDFRSLDIGLYPLTDDEWSRGKSGFKAVQYASCGVPFVASPVGVVREIAGKSGAAFLASSQQDWFEALDRLLSDKRLRVEMGRAGRAFALQAYRLDEQAATLAEILLTSAGR
jgi:glycosyltransferase involved in cell wall biosynthesis